MWSIAITKRPTRVKFVLKKAVLRYSSRQTIALDKIKATLLHEVLRYATKGQILSINSQCKNNFENYQF